MPFDPTQLLEQCHHHLATPPPRRGKKVASPISPKESVSIPQATTQDLDAAATRVRAAQQAWAKKPVWQRAQFAKRLHSLVLKRQDEILDVIQWETGKSRRSAFDEVADVAMTALYYGTKGPRQLAPERRQGALPILTTTRVHYQPRGLVSMISPWNYPFTLPVSDAIPALIAGNGVLLKPDPKTTLSALLGISLMVEAGLPRDLFLAITGDAKALGPDLIGAGDFVMFTGSTATGTLIAQQAAAHLTDFSAELGGKNAMVVLADADQQRAIDGIVPAAFSNAGQLCMSIERLYVDSSIYAGFVAALTKRVSELRLGIGFDYSYDVGSLISQDQLLKVSAHVDDALAHGARLLVGGKPRPDIGPYVFEPTVLEGVTEEMLLCRGETFGPVIAVTPFDTDEEAIAFANDSDYGLNASVWGSASRATEVATQIQAGSVNVNEGFTATWASTDAPMGGMKKSGVGRRHGPEGIRKYAETQTIARQRLANVDAPRGWSHERFTTAMTVGLKALGLFRR
jgi:succinate-semialdehyde dehydrogenase/glutarate-semialdehyde dehydrogenase